MAHNSLGESRTELLSWLNDLLSLSYTKVEQTGTGIIIFNGEAPIFIFWGKGRIL